ncbi:hypothetical protein L218DRAFT_988725 [Marasmius fiardii PR-910]|nr:hypothetical protein L218DRAFT_988725 [Marasmius fiardii PR-910]
MAQEATFHSDLMRNRDQNIQKVHARDLEEKDNEVRRLKRSYERLQKELFDERNGSERLARLIGFETVEEAFSYITAGGDKNSTNYRDCLKRITILESELKKSKEISKVEFGELASKHRIALRELELQSLLIQFRESEKRLLETKYDELERTYKQVSARYAKDIEKFEKWKNWLWHEVEADKDLDDNGRAKKWAMTFRRRLKKISQKGPSAFDDDISDFPDVIGTPQTFLKHSKPPSSSSYPPTIHPSSPLTPTMRVNCESSPTVVVPSPCLSRSNPTPVFHADGTSQGDPISSQASDSATEDESFPDPARFSPPASKPAFSPSAQSRYLKRTQHITTTLRANLSICGGSRYTNLDQPLWNFEPPMKRRRVSESSQSSEGDREEGIDDPFCAKAPEDKENEPMPRSLTRKSRTLTTATSIVGNSSDQISPTSTAATGTSEDPGDYSVYKGRGRYAPISVSSVEDRRLNELFVVNADQNQGLDHEYDHVIRGKERKRLLAGDCDECREYYEAIGPMPPRLHQPLWSSPISSPVKETKEHSCQHVHNKGKGRVEADNTVLGMIPESPTPHRRMVDSHRQEISRHRVQWERGKTPPGYWDIGFPDTQQAQAINEEAKELHRQKFKAVQKEALNGNGRYKRR